MAIRTPQHQIAQQATQNSVNVSRDTTPCYIDARQYLAFKGGANGLAIQLADGTRATIVMNRDGRVMFALDAAQ